jgi:hypothetical protein
MAIIENGILGGFSGKCGPVVGAKHRGQDTMRSKPPKNRSNKSPKQLMQQARFGVAVEFVRHLAGLFEITYKQRAGISTPRNEAVSDIVADAIIGDYPDFRIDYSKVMISSGSLQSAAGTVAGAAGRITWTWIPNVDVNGAQANDQSVIVAYCPERKQAIYKINASTRADGTAILDVQPFVGLTVFTYLGFTSLNQSKISDSVFTGELIAS